MSYLKKGAPRGKWVWDNFTPDPKGQPFEGLRWRNAYEKAVGSD